MTGGVATEPRQNKSEVAHQNVPEFTKESGTTAMQPFVFRPELLKIYYSRLFPYTDVCRWLAYGNDRKLPGSDPSFLQRREFSFTLEGDIYVRYQSFRDAAEMEATIREKCPHKIDIGAVYNVNPTRRSMYQGTAGDTQFSPLERELVFDIDMTDYDDMRTCCEGATVCDRCWALMSVAIKVVDHVLRKDFGFEHILWVFSGRRGVHCWVCDSRARRLSNDQRSAIAEYFRVYKGTEANSRKVSFAGAALHPMLMRAYEEVLLPEFEGRIVAEQRLLEDEAAWTKFLANVPDDAFRERMAQKWRADRRGCGSGDASLARWKELEATLRHEGRKNHSLRRAAEEVVFAHAYPRMDLEVSKHMNHLLKAPFCVHPKTGKVCVPIDPAECDRFSPDQVPTLDKLMEELNQDRGEEQPAGQSELEGTSMHPCITLFRSKFLDSLSAACKAELEAKHHDKLEKQTEGGGGSVHW